MRLRTLGNPGPVPSVEEALEAAKAPGSERWLPALRRRSVVGSPKTVRASLERHAAAYEVDEIMAVTICYDFEKREALLRTARRGIRTGAKRRRRLTAFRLLSTAGGGWSERRGTV